MHVYEQQGEKKMQTMPSVGEDREPLESSPTAGRAVTDTLQTNLAISSTI